MDDETAILEALDAQQADAKELFRLRSGIVLRIKPVASSIVSRGLRASPEPKPPVVCVDEENNIWESNEADPDYIIAMDAWGMARIDSAFRIYMGLGTEFVSAPPTACAPDSSEWSEVLEAVGIKVSTNPKVRYVEWVNLHALTDPSEAAAVALEIMRRSGTLEADVLEAVAWFRDREIRKANRRPAHIQHDTNRDNVPSNDAADGAGIRGTGVSDFQRIHAARMAGNRAV